MYMVHGGAGGPVNGYCRIESKKGNNIKVFPIRGALMYIDLGRTSSPVKGYCRIESKKGTIIKVSPICGALI